ncbi:unnamed protein product [Debaryomyces tyrocola]|nr:unnamed protein product [Debaryomyces tyrocola]
MLLRYFIKPLVPLRYQSCCTRSFACSFATSTTFERATEYEIDLISLKKTTRCKRDTLRAKFKFNPFNLTRLESKLINPDIVTRCVNEVGQDPLDYKNFPISDSKGYLEFIERYNVELRNFFEFIQLTYEREIKTFGQLTSQEILSSLNVFKDYCQKGKIEGVNKYSYTSYNYMFERLSKYLRYDSSFPAFLECNLFNDFENNKIIMDLYKFGIGNFMNELESLSKEFSFEKMTKAEITSAIESTIKQFDDFIQSSEAHNDYSATFFKGCIQIQRYRHLKSILDALPIESSHLLYVLNNENSKLIINKIKDLSGEKESFKKTIISHQAELSFIRFLSEGSFESFARLASFLYKLSITTNDELAQTISLTLLEKFTPFFTNGTLQDSDLRIIELEAIPPATISNSLREDYEFSVLAKIELFNFVDELKLLRTFSNKKFGDLVVADTFKELDNLTGTFTGSSVILDNLKVLELELCTLSRYITWDLSVLDKLVDNPSWVSYLTEVYEAGFENPGKQFDFTKRVPTVPKYTQIPDDLFLHEFVNELKILRTDLLGGFNFKNFSPSGVLSILEHAIEEVQTGYSTSPNLTSDTVDDFIKLNRKLWKLFQFNGGNTGILDTLIHSQSVFESVAKKSKSVQRKEDYTQIPEDIELHKYCKELDILRYELGCPYKDCTVSQIKSFLNDKIDSALNNSKIQASISKENIEKFIKLEESLNKLFMISNYPAILDTLLHSQSVFEEFEKKKKQPNTYTQIPDDLELHKFSNELEIFRDDELKGSYSEYSAGQIESLMNKRMAEVNNGTENLNVASRMNKTNVHEFMRLSRRLARLFDINGGSTGILDTLIQSQSVFDKFEKSKTKSNKYTSPYKQIPDNFMLEEYMLELIQLRTELGGSDFKSFDCKIILETLKKMVTNKKKFNLDKRIAYSKLYRNICYLFKHNGNSSFILDNVLISGEVFAKFETDKAFDKSQNPENLIISQITKFVNEFDVSLNQLFDQLSLNGASDFIGIDELEFDKCISEFLLSNKDSYQYSVYLNMIDKIRFFNLKIHNYPFFLYSLLQKRNTGEIMNDRLVKSVHEESDRVMHNEVKLNESKRKISVPISESANKFDIHDFTEENTKPKQEYTNSAALLASLSKQKSAADLESNGMLKSKHSTDELLKSELEIKDAVSSALNNNQNENHDEHIQLQNLTTEKVREAFKHYTPPSPSPIPTSQIDKSSIESFLNNAKKEKDSAKERKFRESKAYEWSKSMYNTRRSLESHNFFDPIVPISKMSKESKELFFPILNNGEAEYLLLTIGGQTILSKENPLGKNSFPQDMFTILNKFSEEDLGRFIKNVNKLQKNNWRLIGGGSGGENEKMLVLTRNKTAKKDVYLARIKTIFATTGAVFLVLVSLNLWLDDGSVAAIDVSTPMESHTSNNDVDKEAGNNLGIRNTSQENPSTWKKLLWCTK